MTPICHSVTCIVTLRTGGFRWVLSAGVRRGNWNLVRENAWGFDPPSRTKLSRFREEDEDTVVSQKFEEKPEEQLGYEGTLYHALGGTRLIRIAGSISPPSLRHRFPRPRFTPIYGSTIPGLLKESPMAASIPRAVRSRLNSAAPPSLAALLSPPGPVSVRAWLRCPVNCSFPGPALGQGVAGWC